jgi:hypothetical protein
MAVAGRTIAMGGGTAGNTSEWNREEVLEGPIQGMDAKTLPEDRSVARESALALSLSMFVRLL